MYTKGTEYLNSFYYYISILSGPFWACLTGSFICLIPIHNVMEQPWYWYEDQLTKFFAVIPNMICLIIIRAKFWSGFEFEKEFKSYVVLGGFGMSVYLVVTIGYNLLWTKYFGYSLPMAMSEHGAAMSMFVAINVAIWLR